MRNSDKVGTAMLITREQAALIEQIQIGASIEMSKSAVMRAALDRGLPLVLKELCGQPQPNNEPK
jgi:hypothetical protein